MLVESLTIMSLVLSLGSPFYAQRAAAQAALSHTPAATPFLRWGAKSKDAEIAARCKALLCKPKGAFTDCRPMLTLADVPPIDCFERNVLQSWFNGGGEGMEADAIITFFVARAKKEFPSDGGGAPYWNEYRRATLLYGEAVYGAWGASDSDEMNWRSFWDDARAVEKSWHLFTGE